jgi:hypothetical protein
MTDAERNLFELLDRWRRLSVAEGQAITSSDWSRLERLQEEKRLLQPDVTLVNNLLQDELNRLGSVGESAQKRFRALAAGLLALERENDAALAAQQEDCRQQQSELAQTSRTLRRVHGAYVQPGSAGWHSYS